MTTVYQESSAINMENELKIELLTKKDAPRVAEIEKECFSVPFKLDDILGYLDSPIWHFFVARNESCVIGYASFTIIVDECQIVNVATDPSHRKIGVGKALLERLISYAKEKGCKKVFLEVRKSNIPAISLYEKYGFKAVGVSKNHYSLPTEDALLMNLEL